MALFLRSQIFHRCLRFNQFIPRAYSTQHFTPGNARNNTILNIVPQQEAWVVERFGKFLKVLQPGLHVLIPIVDRIRYVQSLKEVAVNIAEQTAITNDNVAISIDGVLFYQVTEPFKASYEIENFEYAMKQLAQTSMRSEIGKLVLDDVFKERDELNKRIVNAVRNAAVKWGIECMRYEIRNVDPPHRIMEAMQMQVEAERRKRAAILESEGLRDAAINRATGDAEAVKIKADSRSSAIKMVAEALNVENSQNAVSYAVAEQYIGAFEKLAKDTNTVVLPKNVGDMTSFITESLAIYRALSKTPGSSTPTVSSSTASNPSVSSTSSHKSTSKSRDAPKNIPPPPSSTWKEKLVS